MKISLCRTLFLLAWLLAAVVQLIFIAHAPKTLVLSGVDYAHANNIMLLRQFILICFGIGLGVVAHFAGKWGPLIIVVSSALYLIQWFPFRSVYMVGPIAVAKSMFLLGSNQSYVLTSITGDIVLPIIFLSCIVFAALEMRRNRRTFPA